MSQRQLVAQLRALIDLVSVRAPGQSQTQVRRAERELSALLAANGDAIDRPYVEHNLGDRRNKWLTQFRIERVRGYQDD